MNRILLVVNLAVLAGITATAAQRVERVNPSGLSGPQAYTHVVKAGKMVFIGVRSARALMERSPGRNERANRAGAEEPADSLVSQGLDFGHVAKTTIYTTNFTEFRSPEVTKSDRGTSARTDRRARSFRLCSWHPRNTKSRSKPLPSRRDASALLRSSVSRK